MRSEIECLFCGKKIKKNAGIHKYCSKECAEIYNKYINRTYYISKFLIFKRDKFKCIYCGESSIEDGVKLVIEHIKPRSKGGTNNINNIATSCQDCNLIKGVTEFDNNILNRIRVRNYKLNKCFRKYEANKIEMIFDNIYYYDKETKRDQKTKKNKSKRNGLFIRNNANDIK